MRILSMKDRLKLQVGDVTFELKPLSVKEMDEVNSHRRNSGGQVEKDILKENATYLKYAVKGLSGIKDYSGNDYELEFENGHLTEDCISDLFTLKLGADFLHAVQKLKQNDTDMTYFGSDKPIENVKLEVLPRPK